MILSVTYFVMTETPIAALFDDPELLPVQISSLGVFGPLMVISLMAIAIVLNPLPSAPVALAAGAVYGHTLGTIYIVTGAEIGAIIAFLIARTVGYNIVNKFIGSTFMGNRFSSQNSLMMIVFASRLVPFMSFDLVSYAAGLTVINFWRYALATLLGLVPISFALAHMGGEMVDASVQKLAIIFLLAVLLMSIPLLLCILRARKVVEADDPGEDL